MDKTDIRKYVALFIVFSALLIGTTIENGFSLGDALFHSLGLKPWSNELGMPGIHYVAIFSIGLSIFGLLLLILPSRTSLTGGKLLAIMIVFYILTPFIVSSSRTIYLSNQSGLEALDYDVNGTHIKYFSNDKNQEITLLAYFRLTSHSKEPVNFHVKFIPLSKSSKETFNTELDLAQVADEKTKDFVLSPGEVKKFIAIAKIKNQSGFTNIKAEEKRAKIVIFNDQQEKSLLRDY